MKLHLFDLDGTPIKSFRILSELDRWKKLGTVEPRSCFDSADGPARIVDAQSGRELHIRHSRGGFKDMTIQLKEVGKRKVVDTLAGYNRGNPKSLERAIFGADCRLAEMAGLGPPTFREDRDTQRSKGTQSHQVTENLAEAAPAQGLGEAFGQAAGRTEGQVTVLRGSFDTTLPVQLDSLIRLASQRMERDFDQETEDHKQFEEKVREISSDLHIRHGGPSASGMQP